MRKTRFRLKGISLIWTLNTVWDRALKGVCIEPIIFARNVIGLSRSSKKLLKTLKVIRAKSSLMRLCHNLIILTSVNTMGTIKMPHTYIYVWSYVLKVLWKIWWKARLLSWRLLKSLIKLYRQWRLFILSVIHIFSLELIHRDLSPKNIFFDSFMNVKIGDFGSMTKFESQSTMPIGTPSYIAPELFEVKEGKYD